VGIPISAKLLDNDQCEFTVWAPLLTSLDVQVWASASASESRSFSLQKDQRGYWRVTVDQVPPESLYCYRLNDDLTRPDPASQCQPEGVHGRSLVIDHRRFIWHDAAWCNLPLESYVCYELHVGTFTSEGTFDAIIPRLDELFDLGINAIELMPVAQFPGDRNWGYDGVYPFAVQTSYGGVDGMKRLVDACHDRGIAVILDVVYNHFGPEGNYTRDFAPYFTERYATPWGAAINFDDAYSDGVRNFCVENVLHWFREFHLDALRLDAIHAIYDRGAKHILAEMAEAVEALSQSQGRPYYLIAESDLNDGRVIRPQAQGGYGLAAQWSDDFHHAAHTLLTGESSGYYEDFGQIDHLADAWKRSFVYNWRYSTHRKRFHGNDVSDRPGNQFIVCGQNHDQIGNRMLGERLTQLISFEGLKLAAANVLLAPAIPLLFMGEEYGEDAPFLYFISHTDADLVQAVREGRNREFAAFHLDADPPDAASVETFERCILHWDQRHQDHHGILRQFYQTLIHLRRSLPPLMNFDRNAIDIRHHEGDRWLRIHRWKDAEEVLIWTNWNSDPMTLPFDAFGFWHKCLDSADPQWGGSGHPLPDTLSATASITMSPWSVALYHRESNHRESNDRESNDR
jgi:maltooligosyltrehalose trehalohydrolase